MILSTRMNEEIREKEQLVYSIGSRIPSGNHLSGVRDDVGSRSDGTEPRPHRLLEKIDVDVCGDGQRGHH